MTAVRAHPSAAAVIRSFGLPISGNNYNRVQTRVRRLGLDTSHWRRNRPGQGRPLEEILVRGTAYANRVTIKSRLLRAGIVRNECYECGMAPVWRGRPLTLVLDHINGVADDWRAENLRMLCPNCNAQADTFCGRNARRGRRRSRDV